MTNRLASEWQWLWRELRPFARYQAAGLASTICASGIGLTGPLVMRWVIDDVLPGQRWVALVAAAGVYFATGFLRTAITSLGLYITTLGVQRLVLRLRARLLAHLQSLSPAFYSAYPVGDLVQRFERDVTLIGELGSEIGPSVLKIVIETTMTAAALVYLDWRIAVIIVPLLPVSGYVRHRFRRSLQRHAESVRDAMGRQSSLLMELLSGVLQVQLLGAERRLARRYYRLGLHTASRQMAQRREELTFNVASMAVISLGMGLVIGYGGFRVMSGSLTTGGLVAFYAYLGGIFVPMSTAVDLYSRLNRIRASIRRIIEIEEAQSGIQDRPDAPPLARPVRALRCTDVSFLYAPGRTVLRAVQFSAHTGERVALVGESGCGKSSLLKLIPRLYEPDGGRIDIDGRDVRDIALRDLRQAIAVVPQDPLLFQGTLRDNLRHACPTATFDEISRAAAIACLNDVVARLPKGWDSELGPGGSGLSGGERQRVAIARALLQRRPILILDEATSALDPNTEQQLLTRLEDWCAGRLTILVSHRVAAARWADRVVVLRRGQVVEEGTHLSLFRPGTCYYALWQRTAESDASNPQR